MSRLNNPRYARPRTRTDMEWRDEAACRDQAPHWDSDADASDRATAMRICRTVCPVRDLCEQAGKDEPAGIWGGIDRQPRAERKVDLDRLAKMSASQRERQVTDRAQFFSTVEALAADGATLEEVCERLEKSSNTLRQRLRVNGRNDLIVTLIANRRRKVAA